jgi:hypothetical protein
MRSISIRAVLIGGISDIVLSNLLGIPLAIYVISSGGLSHLPKDQLQGAVVSAMHANPGLFAAQLGIGYVCSIAGGFIAAWITKGRRLLNGIWRLGFGSVWGCTLWYQGKSRNPCS